MGVAYNGEQHWGREGEEVPDPENGDNARQGRYSRMFFLTATSPADTIKDVLDATPTKLGAAHPVDPESICVRRRAVNLREHWKYWNVFCDYARPATQNLTWSYGSERSEVVPVATALNPGSQNEIVDKTKAIVTSAGEAFDPPPTVAKFRSTIGIGAYVEAVPAAKQKQFLGAINASAINLNGVVYAARTLMCTRYDAQLINTGDLARKWLVNVTLVQEEETWKLHLFDYGTVYYKTADDKAAGTLTTFTTAEHPTRKRLDGNGFALANAAADVFRDFFVYREIEFANIIRD